MSILAELKERFRPALASLVDDVQPLLDLVRRSQDPRFGDYQANFAMPLGKRLGRPPRELAEEIAARVDLSDLCETPEIAGPGFINLKLRDDTLSQRITAAVDDERLGVEPIADPRTYVVDFSAPNVAKPMHVGHIRSTVLGDALCRILRFVGHRVISDNHLGDWGTQFGMILYGFKHFRDQTAYTERPVEELARLYRLVRQLADCQQAVTSLDDLKLEVRRREDQLGVTIAAADANATSPKKKDKKAAKAIKRIESAVQEAREAVASAEAKIEMLASSPELGELSRAHPDIGRSTQQETAKLHGGDEENLRLWHEFLPACQTEIDGIYQRLDVRFDRTLGESFYNDRLGPLLEELIESGVACPSDGATCIFLDGHDVPMLVRKRDGAFLYATTDLATLRYRLETWQPDAILYVVDFRQSLHFEHLFAAATRMGHDDLELVHVSFGTVMDKQGRPFKTRAGDTVGLEGLLDEAVRRAGEVVASNDDAKPTGAELSADVRREVAERVGIGALKYADLSQARTSDYVFDYDKMLAMNGNTGTYMQYAYARVRSIFRRGQIDINALRAAKPPIQLDAPAERALALALLHFGEALEMTLADYRPNQLASYLYDLAGRFSTFFDQCHVLKAETEATRLARLALCDLTARTIKLGLDLLGIHVVEQM